MESLDALLSAVLSAPHDRKRAALKVLRGETVEFESSRSGLVGEPYLSLRQLGKELGISPCTLWRWRIPAHDMGGRRRYRRSEVEAYLKSDAFKRRTAVLRSERKKGANVPRDNNGGVR